MLGGRQTSSEEILLLETKKKKLKNKETINAKDKK
jgi:hypothetical protein